MNRGRAHAFLSRVKSVVLGRPAGSAFAVALTARLIVVVLVAWRFGGTVFGDDVMYTQMAADMASGLASQWDDYTLWLFWDTAAFLVPLTWLHEVTGDGVLAGQLMVAVLGAGTAGLVARLATAAVGPAWGFFSGLAVALLPSQVLWSSLVLKDAMAWTLAAAMALVFAYAVGAPSSRRSLVAIIGIAILLVAQRYVRDHSAVLAAWALVIASMLVASDRRRLLVAASLSIALIVPLATGLGPFGVNVVDDPGVRRASNAAGAATAFVDADAGSAGPALSHLPRGLSVMLFEPLPWRDYGNERLELAKLEMGLWYLLLGLAVVGVVRSRRKADVVAFPLILGVGLLGVTALYEGNLGTAYRHRGEFVWIVGLLAGVGAEWLARRFGSEMEESS